MFGTHLHTRICTKHAQKHGRHVQPSVRDECKTYAVTHITHRTRQPMCGAYYDVAYPAHGMTSHSHIHYQAHGTDKNLTQQR